ncbi:MAG: S4 domain-containing protein [Candidatus Micrarchaeia archaeon]
MASKGMSHHQKRLASSVYAAVKGRKDYTFSKKIAPGPHRASESVALGVLLRDHLGLAKDMREAKKVIKRGDVLVDGRAVRDEDFPVGIMDKITIVPAEKSFEMGIAARKLAPAEVGKDASGSKVCKITAKRTISGGKTMLTTHDGRNFAGDNQYKVGDSIVFDFKAKKPVKTLKFQAGAKCLVTSGYHKGKKAKLLEIIERKGSMDAEAKLDMGGEEFITLAKYLLVIE